jgi:predicted dehydrogenase
MANDPALPLTRRGFLQAAGAGLVTSHVAARAAAAQRVPDPPGRKLGWAIVGLGNLSINQILPSFARCEKSRLAAFVSGSPDKAKTLALRYGLDEKQIYSYDTYERLGSDPSVDVVYIVLPNSMHAEYTIRAAKVGKHVLCEKPMANTPQECEQMIAACRQANRKLSVAYRLRYEPYTQALIKAAREQEFGPLRLVTAESGFNIGNPDQWRLTRKMGGGGSLMDIGVYSLNAARYITGEEPVQVHAMEYSTPNDPRFREVEETINFQLRFPSGVLANCVSSYGAPANRVRATGVKGWIEMEPYLSYTDLRMRASTGNRIEERIYPQVNHFALQMDHLSECAMTGAEPLTPGEDGLKDLRIMMAIYESAKNGKIIDLRS